jgi:transcriptional regulator with XRE-family HTH domain
VGATPKGRALGIALRKARKERNVTLRELGERIGRHSGEISRWENGERPLTPERVAQILAALGINGDRYQDIVSLAYDTKNPPWVATTLPEREQQLSALIDFEQTAKQITAVSPLLVPGLLQTSDYIRSIMVSGKVPPNELPTRVAVRIGRRDAITRTDPVRFVALIGEAVLHQIVGDRAVMIEQLRHLLDMSQLSNVDVRIIPFNTGWHPALEGSFTIIESKHSTPIVQLANRRSTLFVHEDDDIEAYKQAVDQLHSVALSPEESSRLVAGIVDRWEKSP